MKFCWLCGMNENWDAMDKHHIFGGALRDKSEKYGLYVFLHHHDCHIFGCKSAHQSKETAEKLHKWGQRKVMLSEGWDVRRFILEFGKNYLSAAEIEELERERLGELGGLREHVAPSDTELPDVDFYGYLAAKGKL